RHLGERSSTSRCQEAEVAAAAGVEAEEPLLEAPPPEVELAEVAEEAEELDSLEELLDPEVAEAAEVAAESVE
ncbi:MAG: hypothetical protein ACTH9F_14200, partial [Brachybacterium tyrofermentans]